MIQGRIGNDIRIRWAILKQDGTPEDFSDILDSKLIVSCRNWVSQQDHTFDGNIVKMDFIAPEQRYTGFYDIKLTYTKTDATIEGGIATYTIDNCKFLELVPHSCGLVQSQTDQIILEGIVSGLSYFMLGESEKQEITDRLIDSGYLSRINVVDQLPETGTYGEFYATFEN